MAAAKGSNLIRPQLIVFDLDYTLWPFWVDTHVDPPFRKSEDGKVYDAHGILIKPFPDVPSILERLHTDGYKMAVASRTACIKEANSLIDLFDWNKYFTYKEIYPGMKTTHFNKFKKQSGIPLNQMLFFDDEYRNIRDLSPLGVTCVYIDERDGVSNSVVEGGFKSYTEKHKS